MKNTIKKLLGGETKEGLQTKQDKLQQRVQELQTNLSHVQSALTNAEAHFLVDESASNKRVVEKLKAGMIGFQADIASIQEEISTIQEKLTAIATEERTQYIHQLAHEDAQSNKRFLKEGALARYLQQHDLTSTHSSGGYNQLERYLGITVTGNPNTDVTMHDFPEELQIQKGAQNTASAEVDEEFAELVKHIEKFLEKGVN